MRKLVIWSLSVCAMATCGGLLPAADKSTKKVVKSDAVAEIELFEGIQSKLLDVKVIALGSHRANVIIENKTTEPVLVRLPDVFAAVPVLGQFGGPLGGGGQFGAGGGQGGGLFGGQGGGLNGGPFGGQGGGLNGGQGGGGQGLGGGFGGGQLGGGGQFGAGGGGQLGGGMFGGGGQGMFRVETDRPGKLQVETVCLEHGKPDPNPRMKYTIVPLDRFNADPKVKELCTLLANGKVSQNVAQAAAWNIANGISWDALAKKNRRESQYTGNEKYFTQDELRVAINVTGHCRATTEQLIASDTSLRSSSRE